MNLDKNTDKLSIMLEIEYDMIQGLLSCAFCGGSNYWILSVEPHHSEYDKITPQMRGIFSNLETIALYHGYVIVHTQDEPLVNHRLDFATIQRGLRVMLDKYPRHFADAVGENADAITGDVFLQCCLFGEIVYG